MGDETAILSQLQELKEKVDINSASIKTNATSILSNSRNILREKIERELQRKVPYLRLRLDTGKLWENRELGPKEIH
jgi:hypothetical protein